MDLYLGRRTRSHHDLDVGTFRDHATALTRALPEWEFFEAKDGRLSPLKSGERPGEDVHYLWGRPGATAPWMLEVMLDKRQGKDWVFRRNPAVRRPVAELIERDSSGLSYLRPEVQLLYKAKGLRAQDEDDFRRVQPHLNTEEVRWLRKALELTHPGHAWLVALRG